MANKFDEIKQGKSFSNQSPLDKKKKRATCRIITHQSDRRALHQQHIPGKCIRYRSAFVYRKTSVCWDAAGFSGCKPPSWPNSPHLDVFSDRPSSSRRPHPTGGWLAVSLWTRWCCWRFMCEFYVSIGSKWVGGWQKHESRVIESAHSGGERKSNGETGQRQDAHGD